MDISSRPVILVSMPWAPPTEPSLGLAVLRSCLLRRGYCVEVFHASTHFLRWVSLETSLFAAECWGLNEFVFTKAIDEQADEVQLRALVSRAESYVGSGRHPRYQSVSAICDLFLTLREQIAPDFLRECTDYILAKEPILVGFTCMFDQTIASAALAKLLKIRSPRLRTAMGGYALEGPPGDVVSKAFPWIDHVVRGDGEEAICDLARRAVLSARPATGTQAYANGSVTNRNELVVLGECRNRLSRAPAIDLNTSPAPDYRDWLEDTQTLAQMHKISIKTRVFPIESSRGCWWGQQKHCVFCGIDEATLKYRSKSSEAVLEMLYALRERHGDKVAFRFSDYILPKSFYETLLPKLAQVNPKFRLTGEIKANQTPERMRLFSDAGFFELQPGIESFSTPVLRAMDKGVRGIDNVALLKYGYLSRIIIHYNFLYGFPDDRLEDYERMVELIPRLYHLIPPVSRTEVIVTRFAPLQASPKTFGIEQLPVHHQCYDVLLSDSFRTHPGFNLDDYCYYFRRNFEHQDELAASYRILVDQINQWKLQHRQHAVVLEYSIVGDQRITVRDSRFSSTVDYHLSESTSRAYLICDQKPIDISQMQKVMFQEFGYSVSDTRHALHELEEMRLTWADGNFIFGLATHRDVTQERIATQWTKEWTSLYC